MTSKDSSTTLEWGGSAQRSGWLFHSRFPTKHHKNWRRSSKSYFLLSCDRNQLSRQKWSLPSD